MIIGREALISVVQCCILATCHSTSVQEARAEVVSMCVYLSIYLSIYLSVCLSVCLSVYLSICIYTYKIIIYINPYNKNCTIYTSAIFPGMQECVIIVKCIGIMHHVGEGNSNPRQCSCLENPVDRGACWAVAQGGRTEQDTTEAPLQASKQATMHHIYITQGKTMISFNAERAILKIEKFFIIKKKLDK